jgi:hypothetical protein
MGVMAGHSPLVSTLRAGMIDVNVDGKDDRYFIRGGFAEISPTKITVLAEEALPMTEMDLAVLDQRISDAQEDENRRQVGWRSPKGGPNGGRFEACAGGVLVHPGITPRNSWRFARLCYRIAAKHRTAASETQCHDGRARLQAGLDHGGHPLVPVRPFQGHSGAFVRGQGCGAGGI